VKKLNSISLSIAALLIAACSSNPKHDQSVKVLGRIDGLSERPSWVTESEPFKIQDGKVFVIGKHTINSNQNLEQSFRAADLNAKSQLVQAIEQKLLMAFQNSEEGMDNSSQTRFTAMVATDIVTTSAIRSSKRFWEKYLPSDAIDGRDQRIDSFVLVEMDEADFKRAVINAVRKQQSQASLSNDISNKVDEQWNTLMRKPTSAGAPENRE
jgi:hypothetical protein